MPNTKTHRPARRRYTGAPDNFTNPRVTITHWETGITFTTKGERMNVTVSDPYDGTVRTIGTKYLGHYADPTPIQNNQTPSHSRLRTAAAGWLDANPELVAEYGSQLVTVPTNG